MTEQPSTNVSETSRPQLNWIGPALVAAGILILVGYYWSQTRLPARVTIAGGPAGGRYDQLAHQIASELEDRLSISVNVIETQGSLENLTALKSGHVDIAFYQPETQFILDDVNSKEQQHDVEFVSNLYSEYLLPIIVRPPDALTPVTLQAAIDQDFVWSCNGTMSGDYAMLQLLLDHLQTGTDDIQVRSVSYASLTEAFENKAIDLAIVCCGLRTPVLRTLFDDGSVELLDVPFAPAFQQQNVSLRTETIPAGYFSTQPRTIPSHDFQTVALRAQLITSSDSPVRLIEEVTSVLMDPQFQRQQQLTELFSQGKSFATASPEFPMHVGASHIYQPELKPLLNPDFVEGTEGLRSFLVSMIAACWLIHRWWTKRQLLKQEHRLDRYIKDLLELEQKQLGLDGHSDGDEQPLQDLLDQVTLLRQEALAEFSAHELNEDRSVECFIEMCHALSDKISGKLTRYTLIRCSKPEQHE